MLDETIFQKIDFLNTEIIKNHFSCVLELILRFPETYTKPCCTRLATSVTFGGRDNKMGCIFLCHNCESYYLGYIFYQKISRKQAFHT